MSKILSILFLCAVMHTAFAQSKNIATVQKVRGIPVFVMSEPDASYTRVAEVSDDDVASILNSISGDKTYRTIKESCDVIISNAERRHAKGKIGEYDAIIISDDGHTGTCIKWK